MVRVLRRGMMAKIAAGAALAMLFLAAPASARTIMKDISADELVKIMRAQGFSAQADTAADGTPMVIARLGQVKFGVTTYGCKGRQGAMRCSRLQFVTVFDLQGAPSSQAMMAMNAYNNKRLFGRAYIDPEGDAILDMTINLSRGITRDNLVDNVTVWTGVLSNFMSDFGWETGV
ncbi:MAG: YbjN domain-containing protein [Alphaproteobacteria bacterium]